MNSEWLAHCRAMDTRFRAFRELWPVTRGGVRRGRLAGTPLAVKASQRLNGRHITRLVQAGAVIIGTTSIPLPGTRWQTWGYTDRGPTANPFRPDLSPGGSSAGSAVAVATGCVPLATGSDGAGSVRIPAAWCSVVGMKPTAGLLPAGRHAEHGPLARSVADARTYLDALGLEAQLLQGFGSASHRITGLTWSTDLGLGIAVDPEVERVAQAAFRRLVTASGLPQVDRALHLADPGPAWYARRGGATGQRGPGPETVNRNEVTAALSGGVVLATPTTPNKPHGHDGPGPVMSVALTWAFNLTGHPAISIPAGFTADGCPVGLQLVAAHGGDYALLELADLESMAGLGHHVARH